MSTTMALLFGATAGLGLVLAADGWRRRPPAEPATAQVSAWSRRVRGLPAAAPRLAAVAAAGLGVAVVTGWPVAGVLAGLAGVTLPGLLGPDRPGQRAIAKVEAIAGWTELLRSTLAAAAGLQQTIAATAAMAPEPIRDEVATLARRIRAGRRLAEALRAFADDLADPSGDLVAAALLLAADRPGANLAALLGELAGHAREQVAMRQRVAASRARLRTAARIITGFAVGLVLWLVWWNRQWLAPYDTAAGQLAMLAAGGFFAAGLYGLARMSRLATPPRLFNKSDGFEKTDVVPMGNPRWGAGL
jgi:tight adherence protein B